MASLASSTSTILTVSTVSRSTDTQCGLGSCRPWWLQKLANRNVFVLFFACMEIMQATFYSYFRSVITTLERQFAVQSQTIGLVLSGKEISQVFCGLLLAYYGGRGNRPRWIACGMAITAIACLVMVSPIFLYLDNPVIKNDNQDYEIRLGLCHAKDALGLQGATSLWTNGSGIHNVSALTGSCDQELKADTVTALVLLFIGGFIAGVGITLIITLTYPYLDDNVTKSASALYISIMTALQVMGPTVGSVLGGLCLKFYVTLSSNPGITADDPKWIGAWWLGFIIIAAAFGAGALIVIFFPSQLKQESTNEIITASQDTLKSTSSEEKYEKPKIKGLPATLKRLLTNRILVCHAIARCFTLFGTNGFDTFQPKYIESHFRQTASEASFFTGISGNAMRIVGILIVGIVLRLWKPKSVFVNAWNILTDFIYIGSLVALMLLRCPTVEINGFNAHLKPNNTGILLNDQMTCMTNCSCLNVKFNPVCVDNKNYFSPCHAGCQTYQGLKRKNRVYYNCSCATNDSEKDTSGYLLKETLLEFQLQQINNKTAINEELVGKAGYCHYSCSSFTIYLIVLGLMRTLIATKKVSRMLIILRCLDEKDKSLGIAFHAMMESLFAYIPCPIIYGFLLDAACVMWGTNCGHRGNCWLYNSDYLRYVMQGLTLAAVVCATVLDAYVMYLCRSLAFFENTTDERDSRGELNSKQLDSDKGTDDNAISIKELSNHSNSDKSR